MARRGGGAVSVGLGLLAGAAFAVAGTFAAVWVAAGFAPDDAPFKLGLPLAVAALAGFATFLLARKGL